MKLYNTLTGKKENLPAPGDKGLNMFVCGPTVYDYSHIGHARTYVFFDALVKFLRRRLGLKVNYLQNITDIDDRIINRAKESNKIPQEIAQEFTAAYRADMADLAIDGVSAYAAATDYLPEIISQVERLIKKGLAYAAKGSSTALGASSVYFDVRKFPDYGRLSRQKLSELKEGVRVETEPGKKYFADFALWKASKPDEPKWNSPWGEGRPGWHIEDTAITEKNFGPRYHVHGGGMDLIFPHHEAEIAQMESISGLKPLAKIWLHTGFLLVNGEKMSKSLRNFITIRDFLKEHAATTLRYMVLSNHYRAPFDYTEKTASMARSSVQRLADFTARLETVKDQASQFPLDDFTKSFWDNLADDFNTPQAWANMFDLVKEANKFMDNHSLSMVDAQKIIDFVKEVNDIFNILPQQEPAPAEIMALAAEREKARVAHDFAGADEIREQIKKLGWEIDDTPQGPRISKIKN
ncbi:MAG: cysteine--tRNA ligase [Parcubacteria group bacterium]|nr:cysteine--tRNA ligase [Parcubacteria group bacterium]